MSILWHKTTKTDDTQLVLRTDGQILKMTQYLAIAVSRSEIEKFVSPGSRFRIRLTEWSLFLYPKFHA